VVDWIKAGVLKTPSLYIYIQKFKFDGFVKSQIFPPLAGGDQGEGDMNG
jgi:hypothetical protein